MSVEILSRYTGAVLYKSDLTDVRAALVAAVIAVSGWQWKLSGRISKTESDASSAFLNAAAAKMRSDILEDQFNEFRIHVASEYANRDHLEQLEKKLIDAINRLGDRLDKVFEGSR